jgi:AcrR family transcriptional regulator
VEDWEDNVDSGHIVPPNDYSVNMKTPPTAGSAPSAATEAPPARRYHHGDLRNALVEAGLKLLEARGPDAAQDDLGLREVAREVGVSATAIYRHFPDKQALKAALAAEGLAQLAQRQQRASVQAGGGAAGFLASGLSYVHFAAEHPVLFRLVFSDAQHEDLLDAPPDQMSAAMRGLREDVDRLLPADWPAARRKATALHAWALVHGLAMLVLDQQIPPDWALIEQVLAGFGAVVAPA